MKVLCINGSPRKNGNVAKLLMAAADGAKKIGAEVQIVNLYSTAYKGCISCFSCKKLDHSKDGCAQRDELTPILCKVYECDALILGSPVYFANMSSGMRAFLERLLYSYPHREGTSTYKPTGIIYSMNATAEQAERLNYKAYMWGMEDFLIRHFKKLETLWAYDTYQFEDYSQYNVNVDLERKVKQRDGQFPKDLEEAEKMGSRLAELAALNR